MEVARTRSDNGRMRWVVVALLHVGCDWAFRLDDLDPPEDALRVSQLACAAPVPMLASPPSAALVEPGFDATGQIVLVRQGTTLRQLTRPSLTSPFGPPENATALDPTVNDPAFVVIDGETFAFGSQPPAPRHIVICRAPASTTTCEPVTIIDDHDGPTVAVRSGVPLLVFSRGTSLYAARPTTGDLASWTATRLELGGLMVDDGALVADGRILVVPVAGGLVALHWDDSAKAFGDPAVLSIAGESPSVFDQGAVLELAITRSDRGILEPYLARCTRG
jgi:hypothetical protein